MVFAVASTLVPLGNGAVSGTHSAFLGLPAFLGRADKPTAHAGKRRFPRPSRAVARVLTLACGVVLATAFGSHPGDGRGGQAAADEADASSYTRNWTTSRLTGTPEPPLPYVTERVFPRLSFQQPVVLTRVPGSDRMWVAELEGKIYSFPVPSSSAAGVSAAGAAAKDAPPVEAELVADLKEHVEGLRRVYGLTCSPDFPRDRYCYVCYVLDENQPEGTRVSRFEVTRDDPPRLLAGSERVLLSWWSGGHNGGCLKFGPDGYLYISTGDGGPAFPPDPRNSGQDVSTLLSAILRIDVSQSTPETPYRIPPDNPFVETPGARGEIWCYGLRNPWKMSFDPVGGQLWVGDVGWEMWEMIYRVERGANYGWSLVEGPQPVHRERSRGPTPVTPATVLHSHTESRSITGGHVYRGERLAELQGAYVYGDYVTGKVWGVRHDGRQVAWRRELADAPFQIICFGTDHAGELYLMDYNTGTLHRLARNPAGEANRQFPTRLSETGLFASTADERLAAGVVPYEINAEPWEDGASARRYVALPGGQPLDEYDSTNVQIGYIEGTWKFPPGGVLVKTRSMNLRADDPSSRHRVETQVLHFDGDMWRAYSYLWNAEQTDAVLAPAEGAERVLRIEDPSAPGGRREYTWRVVARDECLLCHTTRAGTVHGFHADQLQRTVRRDGRQVDQLDWLEQLGLFARPLPAERPKMVDPHDAAADLTRRARAYLHVNCGHCHRRGGGGTAAIDVRHDLPLERTNLFTRPTQGGFGMPGAGVVVPGDAYRSVLLYRMAKLGPGRMPHFGSHRIDRRGLRLMHDWINSLPASTGEALPGKEAAAADREQLRRQMAELRGQDPATDAWSERAEPLLETTSGALALLFELRAARPWSPVQEDLARRAARHPDVRVADLFQPFLPAAERTRRLGAVVDAAAILRLPGDVERGRRLFLGDGVQCRNCHQVDGQGHALGPDLSDVGKRLTKDRILEAILEPSKDIAPQFTTFLVETRQGRLLSGLLAERGERQVTLRDANHRERVIPRDQIEVLAPQQKSLMPELLLRDLTADQVADLLAFLESCRAEGAKSQPEPAGRKEHADP